MAQRQQQAYIKEFFDEIQEKGSESLAYLFRINFIKIDEIDKDYISIINNSYGAISHDHRDEIIQIARNKGMRQKLFI